MNGQELVKLSRLASHALRHDPAAYGLQPDADGWVPVDALVGAVRAAGGRLAYTTAQDLADMIASSEKQRHELKDGFVRALYGHSLARVVSRPPADPPSTLFHGTSSRAWRLIQTEGLRPMRRHYVHLSVDQEMAGQVGARRGSDVVIIEVDARSAARAGVIFRLGNDRVWLADPIGPEHLQVESPNPERTND